MDAKGHARTSLTISVQLSTPQNFLTYNRSLPVDGIECTPKYAMQTVDDFVDHYGSTPTLKDLRVEVVESSELKFIYTVNEMLAMPIDALREYQGRMVSAVLQELGVTKVADLAAMDVGTFLKAHSSSKLMMKRLREEIYCKSGLVVLRSQS